MKRTIIAAATIAAALLGGKAPAMAGTDITFAISTPLGAMGQRSGERFTELANEKLGDLGQITFYHSDQLGPDKDLMQKLKLGTIQLTHMASVMPSYVEETAIFDMPFLVKDREHVLAIEREWVWDVLAPAFEREGYKLIALWENGFRQITNNVRPITTPADLEGIKLRTPRSQWRVKMFETYGANPTPMPFSEVFVGLQTGAIDGQENPLTHIAANQLHEVQKYLSLSSHVYSPVFVITTTAQWEKFPEEVRTILKETAEEIRPWIYETVEAADARLVGELEAKGMEVNKVDRDAFVQASQPVYDAFDEKIENGRAMIDAILSLAD